MTTVRYLNNKIVVKDGSTHQPSTVINKYGVSTNGLSVGDDTITLSDTGITTPKITVGESVSVEKFTDLHWKRFPLYIKNSGWTSRTDETQGNVSAWFWDKDADSYGGFTDFVAPSNWNYDTPLHLQLFWYSKTAGSATSYCDWVCRWTDLSPSPFDVANNPSNPENYELKNVLINVPAYTMQTLTFDNAIHVHPDTVVGIRFGRTGSPPSDNFLGGSYVITAQLVFE